jgi:hypothetical protein
MENGTVAECDAAGGRVARHTLAVKITGFVPSEKKAGGTAPGLWCE